MKKRSFGYISFIILGVIFIVVSIFGAKNYNTLDGTGYAEIVNIEVSQETVERGGESEIETVYTQFVTYEVDGVKYENVDLGSCNSNAKVGDKVEIVYDTKDPSRVSEKGKKVFYIAGIGGGISILLGVYQIVRSRVKG